jgi:hypothetical protein
LSYTTLLTCWKITAIVLDNQAPEDEPSVRYSGHNLTANKETKWMYMMVYKVDIWPTIS